MLDRRAATLVAIACLAACPSPRPQAPRALDETALRIRIANAEARRAGGIAELSELAAAGPLVQRTLALRGLGRIGGPALATLIGALGDPDPAIIGAAASAIGLATSLDEHDAGRPELTTALLTNLPRARGHEAEVIEGLGRAADPSAQARLVEALAGPPEIAAASAIALGRYGRRKLAISDAARDALAGATRHGELRVRRAAAWALAREHEADKLPEDTRKRIAAALAALIADPDAETRALAISAIGRRKVRVFVEEGKLSQAVADPDWRVAVEAGRVLAIDADGGQRHAALHVLATQVHMIPEDPRRAHVITETLRTLIAAPASISAHARPLAAIEAATRAADLPALTHGWIVCLVAAATVRIDDAAAKLTPLAACGDGKLPDHLRLPLVADAIKARRGAFAERREALRALLAHTDARVRAAGMTAIAALWSEAEQERRGWLGAVIAALASADPVIAGNAVDAANELYEVIAKDSPERDELDAAIVARAGSERDPELAGALFELIGKRAVASVASACRAGLGGAPVRARSAAGCLEALGSPVAAPPLAEAPPPPVDVALVIGKRVVWRLATTRGELAIELRPDVAPWAVAAIATLTRRGAYDGLELHRVVPNFVAQGGDPTQSGWGGPGFALPGEPSSGAGYVAGGVGMADAGRDSAGSQWFVMHSAAPHLDGRYTWVGALASGQKSADGLLIGDEVVKATIEITPAR